MSQWPMVKLGDVCTFSSGGTPNRKKPEFYSGTIPWISSADINENGDISTRRYITDEAIQRSSAIVVPPGTLLLVTRTGVGKVSVSQYALSFSQDITAIEIKNQSIDKDYLVQTIRHFAAPRLLSKARGATILGVKRNDVSNLEIPLPPLEEQRRIARILKLVDLQRDSVNNVLNATLKELRASFFHQTSSLPETEERRLSEVCELYGGASLPKGEPFDNTKNGLLLMRVSDMNEKGNERHIHSTAMHVPNIPETLPNSIAPAHTVVLPKRGAAIATNKKRLTTRYTMLDPNLIGVRCKTPAVNSTYLYEWFENFDLTTITSGSSIPQLNKKDLNPLLIPIPSTTALQGFTGASSKIDEIEQHVRDKLALLEELHQSLATRAFAGQL